MTDITRFNNGDVKTLYKDMGDGTHAEVVATTGTVSQAVPDARTSADLLATYDSFSEVNWASGDFVTLTKYSNGQAVTALSCDPLTPGESRVKLNVPVHQPAALDVEASVVRNRQQFATLTLFSDGDDNSPSPVPDPINIVTISQSTAVDGAAYTGSAGTVVTITLETPLPAYPSDAAVYLSDWINITGLVDTRLNYQNATINFISANRQTVCFGFSDEAALPSLAIATVTPSLGTAKANFYNNMGGAAEGFGLRFTGTSATSAAIVSVFGNGDAQVSGTLFGDHRVTVASSAPQYLNGKMGNVELKATSRYRLEGRPGDCTVLDKAIESATSTFTARASRTSVKPSVHLPLYPRFRVYQPVGMSRPVAKITTIVKAGSTTWTVTTSAAHGMTTGNYVTIKGNRDQTNFAAFATPVAVTVTGANTFTLIGTTGTATGYGGSVCLINGGQDQPGIIGQAVSSVAQYTVNTDWLAVIGNTTWSGIYIGDYINLHGVLQDLTATDLAVDGAWEVAHLSTTTLILKPINGVLGTRVSPVTPAIGTTPVNAGGSVILRTTARMHDLILEDWAENKVMIDGQGTGRLDKSIPVVLVATANVTATQGTAASISTTDGTGGWPIRPSIVGIADIASAAITTTATSASILNDKGNGFQINVPVTVVSGTPTLDLRIEESMDGGTNWRTLYEFPRITAVGSYDSPVLFATGRTIRYVRTIGGGSPSFTMAVTRTLLPLSNPTKTAQLFDRAVSLTTLNATTTALHVENCQDIKLTVNLGAATTAPVLTLQGSEDNTNWFDISPPLTTVASSTVHVFVYSAGVKWARARVSTAGATVTTGYTQIKGF